MTSYVLFMLCVWVFMSQKCNGTKYVDLSYVLDSDSAHWPNGKPFTHNVVAKGYTPKGFWYESYNLCMYEHTGTHLDAPSHFAEGKWTTDQIPISHLMGPGVVIDMKDKVAKDPSAELTTDDLMAWWDEHGPFPDGVIVFVRTGWATRYGNKTEYLGTDTNDTSNLIFPGISKGAAQLLVQYEATTGRRIFGVGLDTPSVDHGPSTEFETHQTLAEANIYGIENVANLDKLPTKGFQVLVLHMKIKGGSGAPAGILATIPDTSAAAPTATILGTPLLLVTSVVLLHINQLF